MVHQIGADGVVSVEREGDFQFRPDAVHARDQHRLAHAGKIRREQTAEAADFAEHFRPVRALHARLDALLDEVAEIDVDSGARVGFFLCVILSEAKDLADGVRFFAPLRMTNENSYFRSAKSVGCASSAASALERPSRFSMMNLSSSGSTGRG